MFSPTLLGKQSLLYEFEGNLRDLSRYHRNQISNFNDIEFNLNFYPPTYNYVPTAYMQVYVPKL